MGMAHQAPAPRYVRKFVVTHHALERFRERVEEDVKCRSNNDVSNLLDEKVCQAKAPYTVRDPRAPDQLTELYEIELRSGTYYAVVRSKTIVTVLDENMVRNNYELSYASPINAPFADKLRDMQVALQPRKLTPKEQMIAAGALPPPAPASPSPLEVAGSEYALAEKNYADCERAVLAAKDMLERAEAALVEANVRRTDLRVKMIALATGGGPESLTALVTSGGDNGGEKR